MDGTNGGTLDTEPASLVVLMTFNASLTINLQRRRCEGRFAILGYLKNVRLFVYLERALCSVHYGVVDLKSERPSGGV